MVTNVFDQFKSDHYAVIASTGILISGLICGPQTGIQVITGYNIPAWPKIKKIMVQRIKTKWHQSKRVHKGKRNRSQKKTLNDRASVIAFNIWKVSQHHYNNLREEGFRYAAEEQGMGTLLEFLAFLLQVVDRMIYGQVPEEERPGFINEVARNLSRNLQANREDLLGPGDYSTPFIALLNERSEEYANCTFENGEPGYGFKMVLAQHISELLSKHGDLSNKWALEHVLEIEIPEALKDLKSIITGALGIKAG